MYASEDAARLKGASERLRRALEKVSTAEAALAQARRELHAVQRAEYGWTDGLAGRRIVADTLDGLAPQGWTFLDAVHWPGRPGVAIDHVGVGPGGVVVMFSRQWTGAVEVRGGVLRQNGIPRLRETAAVSAAAGAVSALLDPQFRTAVSAFVCAVQHDVRPETVSPGVNVVGVRDVGDAVRALTPRLAPGQVAQVLESLHAALVGPQAPDQLTTRALTVYGEAPGWAARDDGFGEDAPPTTALPVLGDGGLPGESVGGPAVAAVPGQGGPAVDLSADLRHDAVDGADDGTGHGSGDTDGRYHGPAAGGLDLAAGVPLPAPSASGLEMLGFGTGLDDGPSWEASRGRHRAPSPLWTRTAHAAERGRELVAVPLAVVATVGCAAAALVAWFGVSFS